MSNKKYQFKLRNFLFYPKYTDNSGIATTETSAPKNMQLKNLFDLTK